MNGPTTYTDPSGTWPWFGAKNFKECMDDVTGTYKQCEKDGWLACYILVVVEYKPWGAPEGWSPECLQMFYVCLTGYKLSCHADYLLGEILCKTLFKK
jgi:hypothetical protein